jgi:hypothetical protein
MEWMIRARDVILVSLAVQPAMLITGFHAVFPDSVGYIYTNIALLIAVSITAGSRLTNVLDIFVAAIVSAGAYLVLFRSLISLIISPYLYQGYEAYSLLSSLLAPGFFYFFVYFFLEVLCLFIGSKMRERWE